MVPLVRFFAIASLLTYSASALAIYKCEENGKTVYSDEKCAIGKITVIDTTSSRIHESAATDAATRNKREKETLKQLEEARRKDEAAEEKTRLKKMQASEALRKKCQAMALKIKWSEEDAAAATGKSVEKSRRIVQRSKEKYEAECGRY